MFRMHRVIARTTLGAVIAVAATLAARSSHAQQHAPQPPQPTSPRAQQPRRPETIEIRGQVPTPQVVTVRPREAPAYGRRVLVPTFFDHDFWPSILPPLQLVVPGSPRADTTGRATVDSASRARPVAPQPRSGTPPAPLRR